MKSRILATSSLVTVKEYCCDAQPGDPAQAEVHHSHSVSYVRRGSFGYHTLGRSWELVAGSVLVGRPGDEFVCTHDHHECGDECLAFHLSPGFVDLLGGAPADWASTGVPPTPQLVVLGELAQAAAQGKAAMAVDEAGAMLAARFAGLGRRGSAHQLRPRPVDARRAVEAALWIDAHSHRPIGLDDMAALHGLSAFHFLRLFSRVLGVTPHQYLLRCRLRHAARLLAGDGPRTITEVAYDVGFADLSNFIRSFHRAAGVSPAGYRDASRAQRKIFQDRIGAMFHHGLPATETQRQDPCMTISD